MIKKIITNTDQLSKKSKRCSFTELNILNNKEIIKDLVFTAVHHKKECLGLAAVQIGENRNIVLVRNIHTKPHEFKYIIMVNLDIFCFTGGVKKSNERCLSFPDRGATPVRRYKRIKFQYQDVTGFR